MVSDSDLVARLREFLRTSDLNTTTTAIVRRKLEEDFGIDLSDKKAFIREQVDLFLQTQLEKNEEEDEVEAGGEEEEDVVEDGEEKPKVNSEEEEEEEEKDEEEETSSRKRRRKALPKKNKEVKKRGGGGGFTKVSSLSPELQNFVGVPEMARTEVVKQIWAYIREHDLQDPNNRRNIICDEALHSLFRVDTINMFQMNKALSKHIWPLETEDAPVKSTPKEKEKEKEKEKQKQRKQERAGADELKPKEKRQKGAGSGFLAPLTLSDALATFLGTGESELSRSDVIKRLWDYIKENKLQDPSDKRRILCDDKLKKLFEVESFVGFTVTKLLSAHLIKSEQ